MGDIYLIELPETDEIGDLVSLMARFAQADYCLITTLKTHSARLAQSVASLTGQTLTPVMKQASEQTSADTEADQPEAETPAEGPDTATRKPCKMCGKPSMKRSTICGRPECKRERQRRWDAAWKEKNSKAAELAADPLQGSQGSAAPVIPVIEATPVEEPAAADLPPFSAKRMVMKLNQMMLPVELMSLEQVEQQIHAGTLPAGTMYQDVSSGRYYEVHPGPAGSTGTRFERVDAPGQVAKQPA